MWLKLLFIILFSFAFFVAADFSLRPELFAASIKKAVYVDGKSRTAIIFSDEKGQLHIQYFTDGSMQFLGEEIFKDGQKVMDTYKENDGLRD